MSPFWTFCTREPSASRMNETYSAWECSALCDVHIILYTIKTYSKRRDYLFSFNLNLDLLTLALENLYFNPLDLEKVQGKSLGCIKSRGGTSPAYCTPTLQGATAEGWKSRMRLASCGLPTPALGKHSLHWIIEHKYGQGFTSFPSKYDGVWFSAGSASLTPVLSVCIFPVILAPVYSPAHYLLQ